MRAVGACGSSSDPIFSVTASSATIPGTITGPTNACLYIGTANVATYTIRKVNGAISYNWLAPAGATITGHPAGTGVNDTTITVTFDNSFVSGTAITVQSVNCNYSTARGLVIYRNAPAQPGLISGPTNVRPFMVSASTRRVPWYNTPHSKWHRLCLITGLPRPTPPLRRIRAVLASTIRSWKCCIQQQLL